VLCGNTVRSVGLIALLLVFSLHANAALGEYQIKAAYLLNFARFIEWPDSATSRGPIVVGVVGVDPFGNALDSALAGKTVRGRALSVRRFRSVQEIDECHILFISNSETRRVAALVQHFVAVPILTVSDSKDFIEAGGAIEFVVADSRVRFDINLQAISASRLKASAQLLGVARALRGGPK